MGRRAIPNKIHILQGGSVKTHRPMNKQEPQPEVALPPCPAHLDEMAKAEWDRTGKLLLEVGLMTDLDMATLAGYCDAYSQWAKATEKVQECGMIFSDWKGIPRLSPYIRIAKDAFDRMMRAGVLLGLSPSARASLKVEKKKPKNKIESFMERKSQLPSAKAIPSPK